MGSLSIDVDAIVDAELVKNCHIFFALLQWWKVEMIGFKTHMHGGCWSDWFINKNSKQQVPLPTKLPMSPFLASVSPTSTVHVSKLPGQDFLVCYCFKKKFIGCWFHQPIRRHPSLQASQQGIFSQQRNACWLACCHTRPKWLLFARRKPIGALLW